jgi:hypothetical protein
VPGTARTVADALRHQGSIAARPLAERLEELGDAVDGGANDRAARLRPTGDDHRVLGCVPEASIRCGELAVGTLLATAWRFDARGAVELLRIDRDVQPLGAIAWAASAKDPSSMPEGIVANLRRRVRYQSYQLEEAGVLAQITAADLSRGLRLATMRAERLLALMPHRLPYGLLVTAEGALARPDPERLETLQGLFVHAERHG